MSAGAATPPTFAARWRAGGGEGRAGAGDGGGAHSAAALLVDELDRADDDCEAFLLELLSDHAVSIPEFGTVPAESPPAVVCCPPTGRGTHTITSRAAASITGWSCPASTGSWRSFASGPPRPARRRGPTSPPLSPGCARWGSSSHTRGNSCRWLAAPRSRPRRVVLLIDVCRSMGPYADTLLRLGYLLVRRHAGASEVFTVGTRLTRLTRELDHHDTARAMEAAAAAVADYSGGTRLGGVLGAFLDRWGQRGSARGAVVVLCSDGWGRGDATELGRQMSRLRRLTHRVAWVTPHEGREGWTPATAGPAAALPHVHTTVAGHSVGALQELLQVIADA